jgi:outer membrane protein assembly factor BamE (lipoprotein component of BamABCDE complex)
MLHPTRARTNVSVCPLHARGGEENHYGYDKAAVTSSALEPWPLGIMHPAVKRCAKGGKPITSNVAGDCCVPSCTKRGVVMRSLFLIVALFALSACVPMGTKVEQEKVSQFVPGKTTYTEVIQQLGEPTQSTMNSDGTRTVTYMYTQSQINAANFIPVVGMFVRGSESENTAVTLNFDKNALLTDFTASEGGTAVGTGLTSGRRQ